MVTIESEVLDGEMITVCTSGKEWALEIKKQGNTIIYHPDEIEEWTGLDRDVVQSLHYAKKIFGGFIGDSFPEVDKPVSSLSEMRNRLLGVE